MASTSWCGKHPSVSPFAGVFCPACFPYLHQSKESVVSNDQSIEQEIQAKGKTAPRITPADIEANIVDTEIVRHVSKTGQVLRWAVLTTRNGFAVVGKPSCAVSSANDNAEIGEKVAVENSREELWPLMGYELRSQLAWIGAATESPVSATGSDE